MNHLHLDPVSGIAGDMLIGALLDLGAPREALDQGLLALPLGEYRLEVRRGMRGVIAGTDFRVLVAGHESARDDAHLGEVPRLHDHAHDHEHPHRHTHHRHDGHEDDHADHAPDHGDHDHHGRTHHAIAAMIGKSALAPSVRERSLAVFARLAGAEARVHGAPIDAVHFHEVGAIDAIIDIVGACLLLDALGNPTVSCGELPLGQGFVTCRHGMLPLPAPATAFLLEGYPCVQTTVRHELVTPTGAALVTTLADEFSPLPSMRLARVGYGLGDADFPDRPNVLRAFLGQRAGVSQRPGEDEVIEATVNLDDMSFESADLLFERLFEAGALDVWLSGALGKKNRPMQVLSVLMPPQRQNAVEAVLFSETTTLGVRFHRRCRRLLSRRGAHFDFQGHRLRVKIAENGGPARRVTVEYDDLARLARHTKRPFAELSREAHEAARAWLLHAPEDAGPPGDG